MKGPILYQFEVSHPDFGKTVVVSAGPESATVAASSVWGVRDEWGKIAAYCSVRRLGPAAKPKCRRCGAEFGVPGEPGSLCPTCAGAEEQFRRERARYAARSRRAGEREQ